MKISGVIAEYNPLHNGHMYHLAEIKKENPDLIIGVISSSLTMRGDISILDKFIKTKEALDAGIDLVIELPLAYSMQRADIFASNAVKLLSLAKVDNIIIGSENNDIKLYEEAYNKDTSINDNTKSMKDNSISLKDFDSNDTLGYFYYKSIKDNNYPITLKTIKRIGNNYKDTKLKEEYSSSTSIRANISEFENYVPFFVAKDKNYLLDEKDIFPMVKYKIISTKPEDLKEIFFVDEGIEYKLKDIRDYNNLDEFITYLSGKKYTKTRMKRMLMYILFNIKKDEMNQITSPEFLRVLGYSNKGKEYLNHLKKDIPIYTNIKEGINPALDIEIRASKVLDSIFGLNLLKLEQKGPITK
ncbi:putative nucleotidyltransferase [Anaeroplasma bactoclasticum]|jgi:predicted nucleotidyltransferase|uniref:tRNA(Met) cytidine acetate ligase n=1 Tax=Anaeroplasma bactoclasticum TaxID=2088 RepID=A0A397R3X4_9MOLU|nr:nucleotidyltransferase family protein [Anaeroplasma bactoclasticum]RIA64874.1 putative nucleotidyltransferase [Anaeroplasma bactoclasticum]